MRLPRRVRLALKALTTNTGPRPDEPDVAVRLAAIRQRLAAVSDGPWEPLGHEHYQSGCRCGSCHDVVGYVVDHPNALHCDDLIANRTASGELNNFGKSLGSCGFGPLLSHADADFAAHAREDIPWLLDQLT